MHSMLDPEQQEVLDAIKAKPGCSNDYIYSKVALERIDIAKIIHRLTTFVKVGLNSNDTTTLASPDLCFAIVHSRMSRPLVLLKYILREFSSVR